MANKNSTRLRKWVHPTTGEVRIYVNSEYTGREVKVWLSDRDEAVYTNGYFPKETSSSIDQYDVLNWALRDLDLAVGASFGELLAVAESN